MAVSQDLWFAAGDINKRVQIELLAVTVPPLRFTPVTRAEHDFRSVRKLEFDLDNGVLTACAAAKPIAHVLPPIGSKSSKEQRARKKEGSTDLLIYCFRYVF